MEKKTFQNVVRKNILFLFCFLIIFSSTLISCFAYDKPVVGDKVVFNSFPNIFIDNSTDFIYWCLIYVNDYSGNFSVIYSKNPIQFNNKSIICGADTRYKIYNGSWTGEKDISGYVCSDSTIWSGQCTVLFSSHNLLYGDTVTYSIDDNNSYDLYVGDVPFSELFNSIGGGETGGETGGSSVDMTETNSILNSIKSSLNAFKDNFNSFSTSIKENITNGFNGVKTKFDTLITTLTTFDDKLMAKLDEIKYSIEYNCNPNHPDIVENEGSFSQSIQNDFNNKYTFIDDFKGSLNNLQGDYGGINIEHNFVLGSFIIPIRINFDWYEPYRTQIKNVMSIFIYCLCGLACLRSIFGVFNVFLGRAVGGVAQDNSLEAGRTTVTTRTNLDTGEVSSYMLHTTTFKGD